MDTTYAIDYYKDAEASDNVVELSTSYMLRHPLPSAKLNERLNAIKTPQYRGTTTMLVKGRLGVSAWRLPGATPLLITFLVRNLAP